MIKIRKEWQSSLKRKPAIPAGFLGIIPENYYCPD
jgi:hypothetical protein